MIKLIELSNDQLLKFLVDEKISLKSMFENKDQAQKNKVPYDVMNDINHVIDIHQSNIIKINDHIKKRNIDQDE